jgi:2-polyprenyl-3-methyl-5-hydroxy-6-metoxy-1,4-benzoquinol methylase
LPNENPRFENYLTRHVAHLGDQEKHRAGKKRQLHRTYGRLFPADRAADMLEIGPGYGQLLELLRRDLGYSRAVAIDLSQEVVGFCNALLPGSTSYEANTQDYLGRHRGRFERVFALHVLEHVPPSIAPDLVRAIRDALRPQGLFVLEVPNMANLFTGGYLRYADLTHESGYTETSLRHLLESAGFAGVECFEERIPVEGPKGVLAAAFRGGARLIQRVVYKGYQLPVPRVLSPALCATAVRPVAPS